MNKVALYGFDVHVYGIQQFCRHPAETILGFNVHIFTSNNSASPTIFNFLLQHICDNFYC